MWQQAAARIVDGTAQGCLNLLGAAMTIASLPLVAFIHHFPSSSQSRAMGIATHAYWEAHDRLEELELIQVSAYLFLMTPHAFFSRKDTTKYPQRPAAITQNDSGIFLDEDGVNTLKT